MAKQLSTGSEWIWLSTSDPGSSETNVSVGNFWLNTGSNDLFVCKNATIASQVWDKYPIIPVSVVHGGTSNTSQNAYSLVAGGTSSTSAFQSINAVATGQVLASNGVSSLPVFTANPTVTSITLGSGTTFSTYLEQQTFTPTVLGSTSAGVGTYTVQSGYYTLIGNMVFIQCEITWTAHTGTGNLLLDNFPFPCRNSVRYNPEGILNTKNISLPGGAARTSLCSLQPGTSTVNIYVTSNAGPNIPVSMSNSGTIHATITYLK